MSKFLCTCGQLVVDNGAITHHMGRILLEQSSEQYHERATHEIADFIKAVQAGKRREWIEQFYDKPGFDLEDSSVVFDIWTRHDPATLIDIYQCDACGRLWVERAPHTFTYRAFKPEQEDWKGALAVKLPEQTGAVTLPVKPPRRPWWKFW